MRSNIIKQVNRLTAGTIPLTAQHLRVTSNNARTFHRAMTASSQASSSLPNAKFSLRRSDERGHADHGWLNTYHTFAFASYHDPRFQQFGSLRVLNEDRVGPQSGFPAHRHANFEIFSYILSGELTHRDSMHGLKANSNQGVDFFTMKRGDIQFTTGGSGIAHSEYNEHKDLIAHFLQIWVKPWVNGVKPRYHTAVFTDEQKREKFVTVISPLVGGPKATTEQEEAAKPSIAGTIPIHADFVMGAALIPAGESREWQIGGSAQGLSKLENRNVYVHLAMTKQGRSQVEVAGSDATLKEGDGVFVTGINAGDILSLKSIGSEEAEVVVLDSD